MHLCGLNLNWRAFSICIAAGSENYPILLLIRSETAGNYRGAIPPPPPVIADVNFFFGAILWLLVCW